MRVCSYNVKICSFVKPCYSHCYFGAGKCQPFSTFKHSCQATFFTKDSSDKPCFPFSEHFLIAQCYSWFMDFWINANLGWAWGLMFPICSVQLSLLAKSHTRCFALFTFSSRWHLEWNCYVFTYDHWPPVPAKSTLTIMISGANLHLTKNRKAIHIRWVVYSRSTMSPWLSHHYSYFQIQSIIYMTCHIVYWGITVQRPSNKHTTTTTSSYVIRVFVRRLLFIIYMTKVKVNNGRERRLKT